jgi:hypothetical protein
LAGSSSPLSLLITSLARRYPLRLLSRHCARSLAAFEIPKTFVFVSELPRAPKGSVDRRKLAESFGVRAA